VQVAQGHVELCVALANRDRRCGAGHSKEATEEPPQGSVAFVAVEIGGRCSHSSKSGAQWLGVLAVLVGDFCSDTALSQ
jgi:hypothetical protein